MQQHHKVGPRDPAPFSPPDIIAKETLELSKAFARLAGTGEHHAYYPHKPAPEFHVDGAVTNRPYWRMTYALIGPQTLWHSYQRDAIFSCAWRILGVSRKRSGR